MVSYGCGTMLGPARSQGCSFGAIDHEKNLSAKPCQKNAYSWVSGQNEHPKWSEGAESEATERAKAACREHHYEETLVPGMNLTFKKEDRILKSIEFRRTLRYGKRFRRPHLTVVALIRPSGKTRIGLTVSKKVGNAVVRNRVKRRLREVARRLRGCLARPRDLIVIAQPSAAGASYDMLWSQLNAVFVELVRQDETATRDLHSGRILSSPSTHMPKRR